MKAVPLAPYAPSSGRLHMCIRAGAAGRRGAGREAFPSAASAAASCRGPSLELQLGPEQVAEPDQPDPLLGPEMSIEPGA